MGVGFFVVEVSAEDLDSSDRQATNNEVGENLRTPREGRGHVINTMIQNC